MKATKTYFFGWTNIKKFITEVINIYTNRASFFSKKRVESSIAFIIGQYGMISYLTIHLPTMVTSDILLWAGVEFAIAGWVINQIQKEKKTETSATEQSDPSDDTTTENMK